MFYSWGAQTEVIVFMKDVEFVIEHNYNNYSCLLRIMHNRHNLNVNISTKPHCDEVRNVRIHFTGDVWFEIQRQVLT